MKREGWDFRKHSQPGGASRGHPAEYTPALNRKKLKRMSACGKSQYGGHFLPAPVRNTPAGKEAWIISSRKLTDETINGSPWVMPRFLGCAHDYMASRESRNRNYWKPDLPPNGFQANLRQISAPLVIPSVMHAARWPGLGAGSASGGCPKYLNSPKRLYSTKDACSKVDMAKREILQGPGCDRGRLSGCDRPLPGRV